MSQVERYDVFVLGSENDMALSVGDGPAVSEDSLLTVTVQDQEEVLLFDLS
jgi:hypothetical protein